MESGFQPFTLLKVGGGNVAAQPTLVVGEPGDRRVNAASNGRPDLANGNFHIPGTKGAINHAVAFSLGKFHRNRHHTVEPGFAVIPDLAVFPGRGKQEAFAGMGAPGRTVGRPWIQVILPFVG